MSVLPGGKGWKNWGPTVLHSRGLDPAGTPSQGTGPSQKGWSSVLWVSPSWIGGGSAQGSGMAASLPALCSGGSAGLEHRAGKNSLTVRSAGCRVPGEGWAWGSSKGSWKEGLGFSEPGWGKATCLPGGEGAAREPQQCRQLPVESWGPRGPLPTWRIRG